ncbi:MAG: asparagine synthase (glutamine-hydrolyzing) [Bacteroidia bacterium]
MCGIAGFYQTREFFNKEDLIKMTDIQSHRGPDAAGYVIHGGGGLGHRRLSILDLSEAANQPYYSEDGRYVIVYNGEVYNFKEISSRLKHTCKTTSDTEVILYAFIEWGKKCVNEFNGMFSFVIYDIQEKQVFIARDRMGIKPLYYYHQDGIFAFSSELKGLLALRPKISLSLNKQAIHDYLLLGYVPEPLSMCKEIAKFPSGHVAVLRNEKLEIESYWKIYDQIKEEVITDEVIAKKQLSDLLDSSISYRMIADVPFGTFLSGGIDSSIVTAFAQKNSDTPINTFSIGFKEGKYNESDFAAQVAKHLKTKHHEFTVTENDALDLLHRMVDAMDEPFADSSVIPTMLVSRLARKHVTMTLSGDGGDELFLGYGSYRWAERMANPLIKVFRKPIYELLKRTGDSRRQRVAGHFKYGNYKKIRTHIFSQEIYYFSEEEITKIMKSPELESSISGIHPDLPRELSPAESQALFDLGHYLKDDLLAKVDRSTMQFSLETRVPLLDYRIVEFALNVSADLKFRKGDAKYLLKQVLYDYVPKEIFNRPKWGFSIPLDRWMRTDLSYLIDKYLNEEVCSRYGIIDYTMLSQYIAEFRQGKDFLYNRLWQIIVLHKHLEKTGIS